LIAGHGLRGNPVARALYGDGRADVQSVRGVGEEQSSERSSAYTKNQFHKVKQFKAG
jgi:hypothetical protein